MYSSNNKVILQSSPQHISFRHPLKIWCYILHTLDPKRNHRGSPYLVSKKSSHWKQTNTHSTSHQARFQYKTYPRTTKFFTFFNRISISNMLAIRIVVSGDRYRKRPHVSRRLQATSMLWCVKSSKQAWKDNKTSIKDWIYYMKISRLHNLILFTSLNK